MWKRWLTNERYASKPGRKSKSDVDTYILCGQEGSIHIIISGYNPLLHKKIKRVATYLLLNNMDSDKICGKS